MVALLPLPLALRDIFVAAGLGLALAVGYCLLRGLLGASAPALFFCDAGVLIVGALLYRAAAMGSFAGGTMRWYTLAAVLAAYAAFLRCFLFFFIRFGILLRRLLFAPFLWLWRNILRCWAKLTTIFLKRRAAAKGKKRGRVRRGAKKGLQKAGTVLYNSQ